MRWLPASWTRNSEMCFRNFIMAQLSSATSEEASVGQIGCRSSQLRRDF